jgi:DNA-binding response OmpR family regulator
MVMNGLPKTIAVVDDDETTHYLVSVMLKAQLPGVNILQFMSAVEYLEEYHKGNGHADAMLLDINMPKMSGWELLSKLQPEGFSTTVHMFSSSEDSRDLIRVSEYACCKGYIVKPLTFEKVKRYVAELTT